VSTLNIHLIPGSGSRKKRAAESSTPAVNISVSPRNVLPPTWKVNTTSPYITLTGLEPNSIYNISVVAATPAGSGKEPAFATFTTREFYF
jgi:hypothetical protein